jgi:hypothetical protein
LPVRAHIGPGPAEVTRADAWTVDRYRASPVFLGRFGVQRTDGGEEFPPLPTAGSSSGQRNALPKEWARFGSLGHAVDVSHHPTRFA